MQLRAITSTVRRNTTAVMMTVVAVTDVCMDRTVWVVRAQTTLIVDLGKTVAMEDALMTTHV